MQKLLVFDSEKEGDMREADIAFQYLNLYIALQRISSRIIYDYKHKELSESERALLDEVVAMINEECEEIKWLLD